MACQRAKRRVSMKATMLMLLSWQNCWRNENQKVSSLRTSGRGLQTRKALLRGKGREIPGKKMCDSCATRSLSASWNEKNLFVYVICHTRTEVGKAPASDKAQQSKLSRQVASRWTICDTDICEPDIPMPDISGLCPTPFDRLQKAVYFPFFFG